MEKKHQIQSDKTLLQYELEILEIDREIHEAKRKLNTFFAEFDELLGLYAQVQTKMKITELFEKRNINLTAFSNNYVKKIAKNFIYEIDILFYANDYTIVFAVKNQVRKSDIDDHIERLEKCIQFPPSGIDDSILLGGIATMIISEEVENYARKKGLYIIKPNGKSVTISNPKDFKPTEWYAQPKSNN